MSFVELLFWNGLEEPLVWMSLVASLIWMSLVASLIWMSLVGSLIWMSLVESIVWMSRGGRTESYWIPPGEVYNNITYIGEPLCKNRNTTVLRFEAPCSTVFCFESPCRVMLLGR